MMGKKWVIALIAIMILTGCRQVPEESELLEPEEPVVEAPVEEEPEPIVEEPEEPSVYEEFELLLTQESSADNLGIFIASRIAEANQEESEKMIEFLVIYQSELIHVMSGQIYQNIYMDALNNDMGGILDPSKVDQIADEKIRGEFQSLIDGYLTIVRYEETPVVETDWQALSELSDNFSEDFQTMIRLNDKIQRFDYNRRDPDFEALANDALMVEKLIRAHDRSFLTWQLEMLYQKQIGNLLVGPEGSYIGTFSEKSGALYEALIRVAEQNPEADLSQFIMTLDQSENDDFFEVIDTINNYKQFGFKVEYLMERETIDEDGAKIDRILIRMPSNAELEEKINEVLLSQAQDLVVSAQIEGEYSVYMHPIFETDRYMSVIMSVSYTDSVNGFGYEDRYVNIDLDSGEIMTLEDYFEKPYEEFDGELIALTGVEFEKMPEFGLNSLGISLSAKRTGQARDDYAFLTLKDLYQFGTIEKQYK